MNQSLYVWGKTMLPNYILSNLGDRMEMAHSVEGRLPFLDHHVVEAAARMPVSMKINGMTEKCVLREAARRRCRRHGLPPAEAPVHVAARDAAAEGRLFTLLQDTLRGSALDGPGIYDRRKVVRLLDAVPTHGRGGARSRRRPADVDGEPLPAARDAASLEPERVDCRPDSVESGCDAAR